MVQGRGVIRDEPAQRPAVGLFPRALKGLGVSDDALGACVGVEDGVGDVVGCCSGAHVVDVFRVGRGVGWEVLVFFGIGGARGTVTIFGVRGVFLPALLEELVEFGLGSRGHDERRRARRKDGEKGIFYKPGSQFSGQINFFP